MRRLLITTMIGTGVITAGTNAAGTVMSIEMIDATGTVTMTEDVAMGEAMDAMMTN